MVDIKKLSCEEVQEKIDAIVRHKELVKDACLVLSKKLIKEGKNELGLKLVELSYTHDISKFHDIQFLYLNNCCKKETPEIFEIAKQNHCKENLHHVNAHESFSDMPCVYIAELSCDLLARSQEFGTNLLNYIDSVFTKEHNIDKESEKYKWFIHCVSLLLENSFK